MVVSKIDLSLEVIRSGVIHLYLDLAPLAVLALTLSARAMFLRKPRMDIYHARGIYLLRRGTEADGFSGRFAVQSGWLPPSQIISLRPGWLGCP